MKRSIRLLFAGLLAAAVIAAGMLPVTEKGGAQAADAISSAVGTAGAPAAADPGTAGPDAAARGGMTDIHDIRPLRPPGPDAGPLLFGLLALGALLAAALGAHLWRRRRRRLKGGVVPALAPDAAALAALDALSDFEEIDGRRFYFRLSAVLRRYLRERYAIPASEMTLEELLPELDRLGLERGRALRLRERLSAAERVKYAGRSAEADRMKDDLAFARGFILETASAEKTAAEGGEEAAG